MSHNICDDSFYCTEEKTSTVKMMTQNNTYFYKYVADSGFKCLKVPYKRQDFSMLIILPNDRFGLDEVIETLDTKAIKNLKKKIQSKKVSLA